MPSLKCSTFTKFCVNIDMLNLIKKKKKKRNDYSFLTKSSKPPLLASSPSPAQEPASKERFLPSMSFSFFLPHSKHNRKKNPSLDPTRVLRFIIKTSHLTLHFLLHEAERMLINFSVLHSPSLPSLLPFCSILPPPQGRRPPYLQRPRLLTRRTWRRAKRLRRSLTPPDIQPSCIRNYRARRRSRTVGFEIGCPLLMRL